MLTPYTTDVCSDKLAVSIYECHKNNGVEPFVVVIVVVPSIWKRCLKDT